MPKKICLPFFPIVLGLIFSGCGKQVPSADTQSPNESVAVEDPKETVGAKEHPPFLATLKTPETTEEAEAFCNHLAGFSWAQNKPFDDEDWSPSSVEQIMEKFTAVETKDAISVFADKGLPPLREMVAQHVKNGVSQHDDDVVTILDNLIQFGEEEDIDLLGQVADSMVGTEGRYLKNWDYLFGKIDADHPQATKLFNRLKSPLRVDELGASFYNWTSTMIQTGATFEHPLSSPEGVLLLKKQLEKVAKTELNSFQMSAASALQFINPKAQAELGAIALAAPDALVQWNAAAGLARGGHKLGVERMVEYCKGRQREAAAEILTEIGKSNLIPKG